MKCKILLFLLLVSVCACSQNSIIAPFLGEWLLKTDYEAPDLIVFRSDYKYFVYNDMDFVGIPNKSLEYDIILDNGKATALTETGIWSHDQKTNQIVLKNRVFIKKVSEFNSYYGKGEKLVFNIEEINKEVLIICSIEKENSCDTYIKNANNTGDKTKIYYQEIVEKYSSKGTQNKTIDLSGYERDLKISYEFFKEPDELIIEDRNGKVLFSTKMKTTKEEQTTEVDLKGVTQLFFKVNCSEPESKWKFSLSVK